MCLVLVRYHVAFNSRESDPTHCRSWSLIHIIVRASLVVTFFPIKIYIFCGFPSTVERIWILQISFHISTAVFLHSWHIIHHIDRLNSTTPLALNSKHSLKSPTSKLHDFSFPYAVIVMVEKFISGPLTWLDTEQDRIRITNGLDPTLWLIEL